jgi:alkylated DNA repair dioxygenase AlkB
LPELSQAQTQIDSDVVSNATTEDEVDLESSHQSTACLEEQHQLYKIADKLFANRNSVVAKPSPAGRPEVWADGRQELCETLHYFRSYQSACYCTGGFARGFMFDKVAHVRDYIDCNVIISRAGGGLIKHKDSGEMRTGGDQSEDTPIVQGLRNCIKHYNPVVVITGIDNPHIPSQPPHQYCVLDYFKPTNIWVEKSGDSKILRYRFEKLNTEKDSWWRPKDEQDPITLGTLDPPFENSCECCGVKSTQIYLNGWMCLQPSCIAFWRIIDDHRLGPYKVSYEPEEASLTYDPRFLKQKTAWPNDQHNYPLGSDGPELSVHSIPGEDTSQAYWSGIVCPDCGRCNSRLKWMGWGCLNPSCSFKREPPHTLIPAATLRQPFWPITNSYTMSRDTHDPIIDVKVSFAHGYRINRYSIPGLEGFITHMIANKTVLKEPGGPDAMFEELQRTDIDLQRRAMPNGQLKGESYCRQFTVNYGMPYKFIAATASHSFEHAARPINATRSRLNWAAKHLLSQEEPGKSTDAIAQDWKPKEFNEVLALGYFESQKINYHDDGEFGLGPTIATLSLGAPGTMRIRMKARHYHGASNAGVYDDARPLPGCKQFDARAALQPSLEALKASDPKAYRARLKQIPKELGLKTTGNAKDVLRMELGHGDVVVMHGAEVQKYYEHAVEHAGKLRFALTCRYIDEGSLKEGDKPGYVVGPDCGDYDGSKLC